MVRHQLGPVRVRPISHEKAKIPNNDSAAAEESSATISDLESLKWLGTRGLEDGKTYQVGVDEGAEIVRWIYGTKARILMEREQKGWSWIWAWFDGEKSKRSLRGLMQSSKIPFKLVDTAAILGWEGRKSRYPDR